ncbi:MAG: YdeI/OmpD-associated family protein [Prolixibacteraceae bacterium]|jgi:uncharacterized protein YdeI (YjbR/CyaY-like superfamily)
MSANSDIGPLFFKNSAEFRKWLEGNHLTKTELLVGFYKIGTGKPSMIWSEAVDEAICFGWIDGIRKSIDQESYMNRFTPRNPKSNWSAINIKKVEELIRLGKMFPAGMDAFEKRNKTPQVGYSYENKPEKLDPELEEKFRKNTKAWDFFQKQSTSYKRTMYFYVLDAKQESTRISRLDKLIAASESGKRIQ